MTFKVSSFKVISIDLFGLTVCAVIKSNPALLFLFLSLFFTKTITFYVVYHLLCPNPPYFCVFFSLHFFFVSLKGSLVFTFSLTIGEFFTQKLNAECSGKNHIKPEPVISKLSYCRNKIEETWGIGEMVSSYSSEEEIINT